MTVVQGADGIGLVTGEVPPAADASAIDAMLAAAARSLGAEDPRTEQQRRADLFADLLLGRLTFDDNTDDDDRTTSGQSDSDQAGTDESDNGESDNDGGSDGDGDSDRDTAAHEADVSEWLEVEIIDPDTGELLGTQLQRVDSRRAADRGTGRPGDTSHVLNDRN